MTGESRTWPGTLAPIAMAALVAVGFGDFDQIGTAPEPTPGGPFGFRFVLRIAQLAPFFPLLMLALACLTGLHLPRGVARFLSFLSVALGLTITAASAAASGPGSLIVLVEGIALTLAVAATFRLLARPDGDARTRRAALMRMAPATAVALWSLGAAGLIAASATRISDGRPYCLARHGDTEAVESLAALRGLSFYTTRSGYKSSSNWYMHGILIVETGAAPEVYNWSPRRLRFDRLREPGRLTIDPRGNCKPRADFLAALPLL